MKLRLKRNIGALALLLLVAAGMALPQQRRVVTIVPTEPRIGQPMYIVYDPAASEATLKHPLNVTLILNGYARPSVRGKLSSQSAQNHGAKTCNYTARRESQQIGRKMKKMRIF